MLQRLQTLASPTSDSPNRGATLVIGSVQINSYSSALETVLGGSNSVKAIMVSVGWGNENWSALGQYWTLPNHTTRYKYAPKLGGRSNSAAKSNSS